MPGRRRTDQLTPRELEVLKLLGHGLTNREMAEALSLSTRTVEAHLRSIYPKLGVNTRSAATRYVVENGLD